MARSVTETTHCDTDGGDRAYGWRVEIRTGRLRFGPDSGRVLLRTGRNGVGSSAGHYLTIEALDWSAKMTVPETGFTDATAAAHVELAPLASGRVLAARRRWQTRTGATSRTTRGGR